MDTVKLGSEDITQDVTHISPPADEPVVMGVTLLGTAERFASSKIKDLLGKQIEISRNNTVFTGELIEVRVEAKEEKVNLMCVGTVEHKANAVTPFNVIRNSDGAMEFRDESSIAEFGENPLVIDLDRFGLKELEKAMKEANAKGRIT